MISFTEEEILEAIKEGRAQLVHLYDYKDMLRPRGSMKKESLSQYICDKLMDVFSTWNDPKFADSITDERELIYLIQENLHEEVEIATQEFLKNLRESGVKGAYQYRM